MAIQYDLIDLGEIISTCKEIWWRSFRSSLNSRLFTIYAG